MLPIADASAGPATTGSPQASAVSWHSSAFLAPPPTSTGGGQTFTAAPGTDLKFLTVVCR